MIDFFDALLLPLAAQQRTPPQPGCAQHQAIDDVEGNGILRAGTDTVVEGALGHQHPVDIAGTIGAFEMVAFLAKRGDILFARLFDELLDDERFDACRGCDRHSRHRRAK